MKDLDRMSEGESFIEVYDAYYDSIYKYALMLLMNKEDAEDVTAETFVRAYTNFSRYDAGKASIRTWLTRIAHNQAVNLMRSAAYAKRTDLSEEWQQADPAGDFTGQIMDSDIVMRLYAQLDPEDRELLNMRCVMELRFAEIAEIVHVPEKTINKRYQRLLIRCRWILNGEELLK